MSLASRLVRYAPSIRRAHEQYATGPAHPGGDDRAARGSADLRAAGLARLAHGRRRRRQPRRLAALRGRPATAAARPGTLVFLHGGAYFREMRDWHWRFVERLVRAAGVTVLVPIYPLAPVGTADSVVPAVVDLARDVLRRPGAPGVPGAATRPARGWPWPSPRSSRRSTTESALSGLVLVSPWVDVACDDPGLAARAHSTPGSRRRGCERPASHTEARSTPTIPGSAPSTATCRAAADARRSAVPTTSSTPTRTVWSTP